VELYRIFDKKSRCKDNDKSYPQPTNLTSSDNDCYNQLILILSNNKIDDPRFRPNRNRDNLAHTLWNWGKIPRLCRNGKPCFALMSFAGQVLLTGLPGVA